MNKLDTIAEICLIIYVACFWFDGCAARADDADVAAAIASANLRHQQRQSESEIRSPLREPVKIESPKSKQPEKIKEKPVEGDLRMVTYAEAYREALTSKKPLLVWCGGDFCPRCVNESRDEFIHCFVDDFPGAVIPSIVVCVLDDGKLMRLTGDVTSWIEGDREFGHLPTVRKRLRAYSDRVKGVLRGSPLLGEQPTRIQVVPSRGRVMRAWSVGSGSC